MIGVNKKDNNETFDGLLKRFTRKFFESGLKIEVNRRRYFKKDATKNLLKKRANRRNEILDQLAYDIKVGKVEENPYGKR